LQRRLCLRVSLGIHRDIIGRATLIDLSGLTPIGIRSVPERPLLLWRIDGKVVETDFSRFRPVRLVPPTAGADVHALWRDFGDLPMTDPFFQGTVRKARGLENAAGVFETDWDVVQSVATQPGNVPLGGMICHMARTGSTLIHRLLQATGRVLSLSEVGMVLRFLERADRFAERDRGRMLRDIIGAYGQPRSVAESHFVLKMTDTVSNTRLPDLRQAFPTVPWIFVYRDPLEVMVSLMREPSGTMKNWKRNRQRQARVLKMRELADEAMGVEEFIALTLQRSCSEAVQAARATTPGLFLAVSYERLPDAIWETIAPHFGISLTADDRAAMEAEARYSAKVQGNVEFRPDSDEKRKQAAPWMRDLAERVVAPAIEELRSLPQA
jgi:hypothetical protein